MDLTHKILSDYSYYLRIERAMSHNTVEAYSSDLESLFSYLGVEPAQVTTQDVLDYLAINNKISKRSQSRQLSAFRSFFDWLVMEGDRMDNPCDPIDTPKIGRYLPEVLSVEEVGAIMDSVDLSKWTGVRDRAILEVLYGCGLRVSEAVGLKISQVYLDDGFVRVVGKGSFVTSTLRVSGRSFMRALTRIALETRTNLPPFWTPTGWPLTTTGTLMAMGLSSETARKSTWRQLSFTGWNWSS